MARYLERLDEETAHLRHSRLIALGELQYAAEQRLSDHHRAVRAARARLRFAERMLLRLALYRADLERRRDELQLEHRRRR